jgi:hypothetical protein
MELRARAPSRKSSALQKGGQPAAWSALFGFGPRSGELYSLRLSLHVCRHVRENVVGSRQRRKWFDGILAIAQHGIHFMQECRGTICRRYAQDVVLLQVTGGQRTQLVSQLRGETIQILILISRSAWASAPQDRAGLSPERRDSEHPAPSNV